MTSMPLTMPLQGGVQTQVARTLATLMAELGLKTGMPVSAQVIGPLPDGTTQVQVLDRMLKLPLPQGLPAGTTVTLQLRPTPEGQQLAVTLPPDVAQPRSTMPQPAPLPQTPPPTTPPSASPPPLPQGVPASVELLATPRLALPAATPSPVTPGTTPPPAASAPASPAPVATGAPQVQPGAAPPPAAARATSSAPLPPPPQTVARADVPMALRTLLAAPPAQTTAAATPQAPRVPATQAPAPASQAVPNTSSPQAAPPPVPSAPVLTGTVTGRTPDGLTQITAGGQSVALPLKVAPPVGSMVTLSLAPPNPGAPMPPGGVLVQPAVPAPAVVQAAPAPTPPGTPSLAAMPAIGTQPASVGAHANNPLPLAATPPAAPLRAPTDAASLALRDAGALAAGRQTSLAPLLTTLAQLQGRLGHLPAPVAQAAMQLLGSRLNADRPITGAALQQAAQKSGIFLEADMGTPNPAQAARGDVKANLLRLQGGLATLFGAGQAPVEAVRRAAPPLRGLPPRAQAPDAPPPLPESREAIGKQLLSQAEGALHRMRLSQMASLPDAAPAGAQRADGPAEWNFEIPLLVGRELAMLALQIHRDGRNKASKAGRGWQMKFSLNFSELGEVGANVSFRDEVTSISLWAEDAETAAGLNALLPELADGLAARGVSVGSLVCRVGAPRDGQVPAGRLVDARK